LQLCHSQLVHIVPIAPSRCRGGTLATPRPMDNPRRRAIVRNMSRDADILIVGGGLNGPCLAIALAQAGLQLHRHRRPARGNPDGQAEFDGRSYALALASVRMLRMRWACGTGLEDDAQPILEIKASDGRAGEGAAPHVPAFRPCRDRGRADGPHAGGSLPPPRPDLDAMAAEPLITHMAGTDRCRAEHGRRGRPSRSPMARILTGRALLIGADGRRSGTARSGRHQAHRLGLRADGAGLRHRP
jgi:2-octaprenyl-6-methoxyphenol hydroxylase